MKTTLSVVLLAVLTVGCSRVTRVVDKLSPVRESRPVLARGWTYVEEDQDRLNLEAGVGQATLGSPVIVNEKVVFGSERFGIVAVNKKTGRRLWQREVPYGVSGQILVKKNRIYVGGDDGKFRCLELDSGRELWVTNVDFPVQGSPVFAADRLYTYTNNDMIHALDPDTGKILWSYRRPPNGRTKVLGGGNLTYYIGMVWSGFSDGAIVGLDPLEGTVKQEITLADNTKFTDIDAQPLPWKAGLLVTTFDGKLRYLRKDLTEVWQFPAGGSRAPVVHGDTLYFSSSEGTIYALNGSTGQEKWRFVLKRGVPTGLIMVNRGNRNILVAGTSNDHIYAIDPETGSDLGSVRLGGNSGTFSSIALDDETGNIFLLSSFSRLFQLRLQI